MTVLENIVQARCGGAVQRCHGVRHTGSYDNAQHSWGVAVLLWYLYPEHAARLIPYALFHDVPEAWWGDIPGTVLKNLPELKEALSEFEDDTNRSIGALPEGDLGPMDMAMLKACDKLELLFWCKEQYLQGNLFAREFEIELIHVLKSQELPGRARELVDEIASTPTDMGFLPRQAAVVREAVTRANIKPDVELHSWHKMDGSTIICGQGRNCSHAFHSAFPGHVESHQVHMKLSENQSGLPRGFVRCGRLIARLFPEEYPS